MGIVLKYRFWVLVLLLIFVLCPTTGSVEEKSYRTLHIIDNSLILDDLDERADAPLAGEYTFYQYGGNLYRVGSDGVAQRVFFNVPSRFILSFDPGNWYISDPELFIAEIEAVDAPNGIELISWTTSCNIVPDVEMTADLYYADNWITLANSQLIVAIDTVYGISSGSFSPYHEVPVETVMYVKFGSDPQGTATQWHIEIRYRLK